MSWGCVCMCLYAGVLVDVLGVCVLGMCVCVYVYAGVLIVEVLGVGMCVCVVGVCTQES